MLVQRDALTGTPPSWGPETAKSSSQTANVLVDASPPEELCHPWPGFATGRTLKTDPVVSPGAGGSCVESGDVTKVFLLALAASLDAVLVATVVLLLGQPRPPRQLLAFWLGAIGVSTAIGLVVVLALGRPGLRVNQHGSASPGIEIAAGVALLAIAAAVGSGLTARLKSSEATRTMSRTPSDAHR